MSSVKILVIGAVSIAIKFGLAIAGWGGWDAFSAHPSLRALAWVTVGLAALAVLNSSAAARYLRRAPDVRGAKNADSSHVFLFNVLSRTNGAAT